MFLPDPMDHPALDEVAALIRSGATTIATDVTRAVLGSDLSMIPSFVLVVVDQGNWQIVARGSVLVNLDHGGDVTTLDPSVFGVVLEHHPDVMPDAVRVGDFPVHDMFRIDGVGIVPADGLVIGAVTEVGTWSDGRDAVQEVFERAERSIVSAADDGTPPGGSEDSAFGQSPFEVSLPELRSVGKFEGPEFERSESGVGAEDAEADQDDGPLTGIADLFGTPAGQTESDVANGRPMSDHDDATTSPVPGTAAMFEPSAVGVGPSPLASVAIPNATNMPSKTEIDRLREQLKADMAQAGYATPHASASLVRGRGCVNGHLNELTDAVCRQCGQPIPFGAATTTGPRPRLGRLEFDNGQVVNLDRPVVIGRNPPTDHVVGGETANPVTVTDIDMRISSFHVRLYFEGWNVVVENPGSTNSTWVSVPGGHRIELRRGQPISIRPGATVTMADRRSFTFLVP